MVIEGIILRHKISAAGLEVDQAKVFFIETQLPPTTVKAFRSFWGMLDFIEDLLKVKGQHIT